MPFFLAPCSLFLFFSYTFCLSRRLGERRTNALQNAPKTHQNVSSRPQPTLHSDGSLTRAATNLPKMQSKPSKIHHIDLHRPYILSTNGPRKYESMKVRKYESTHMQSKPSKTLQIDLNRPYILTRAAPSLPKMQPKPSKTLQNAPSRPLPTRLSDQMETCNRGHGKRFTNLDC